MKTYIGIDYGLGKSNINMETGIRYGVIPANSTIDYGSDYMETVYFDIEHDSDCALLTDDAYASNSYPECTCGAENTESVVSHYEYSVEGYQLRQGSEDNDIFVLESRYYTHACFCSPCAPGACYLLNPDREAPKAYCLNHDFFDGDKAPYPVFRVSDDTEVLPPTE